jgi:hypothetical protein
MNKKGGIVGVILDVVVILLLAFSVYIIYKNFDLSCMWGNIKSFSFSKISMGNCIKP